MNLCDNCKKNIATVHVEKVVNNVKSEYNLCLECAQKFDGNISFDSFFQNLLESMFSAQIEPANANKTNFVTSSYTCKTCGLTYDKFKQISRFGCKDCYETFRPQIEVVLKNLQGSNRHEGKYPKKNSSDLIYYKQLDLLKKSLAKAIAEEEYEQAAMFRDQIKELNKTLKSDNK